QLFIHGDLDELVDRHMKLAEETGTFLFYNLRLSPVPSISQTEIHCRENALAFDTSGLPSFVEKLVSPS
ncbi:unnamed protein product, partial [marine sediment metagenome]